MVLGAGVLSLTAKWQNVSIETVVGTGAGTSLRMKAILPFRRVTGT